MSDPDITYVTFIASTPERLWQALTSSDDLRRYWYGRRFETDWKPGSPMKVLKPDGGVDWDGKVLEVDPPRRLSYTMQILGLQKSSSRLVLEIAPEGSLVKLTLKHFDIEPGCVENIREAWPAFCSTIKTLLETGRPLPFPE